MKSKLFTGSSASKERQLHCCFPYKTTGTPAYRQVSSRPPAQQLAPLLAPRGLGLIASSLALQLNPNIELPNLGLLSSWILTAILIQC